MTTFTCNTKMLNAKRSRRSILQLRQIREGRNLQNLQNLVEVPPATQDPPSKQTMAAVSPGTATTTDAGTASATNDFGYMRTHRSSRTPRADNTRPSLGDLREASVLPQLGKLTVLAPPPQIHALKKAAKEKPCSKQKPQSNQSASTTARLLGQGGVGGGNTSDEGRPGQAPPRVIRPLSTPIRDPPPSTPSQ